MVKIPAGGHLLTSTTFEEGTAQDEFYYETPSGRQTLPDEGPRQNWRVWNDHMEFVGTNERGREDQIQSTARMFFIGTGQEFDRFAAYNRVGQLRTDRLLTGRKLRYQNIKGRNFIKQSFVGADMSYVRAEKARFERADLDWAALHWAGLEHCNLRGASLRNADLLNADLRDTDLRHADLSNAWLEGADLRSARIDHAKWHGARYDINTRWPSGFKPEKHRAVLVAPHPSKS